MHHKLHLSSVCFSSGCYCSLRQVDDILPRRHTVGHFRAPRAPGLIARPSWSDLPPLPMVPLSPEVQGHPVPPTLAPPGRGRLEHISGSSGANTHVMSYIKV